MDAIVLFLFSTLSAGALLALAALGLLINEKSGVVNLGAEGMMLTSALASFAALVHTGSFTLCFLVRAGVAVSLATLSGLLTIGLHTSQYATGIALSVFGMGFSAFFGVQYVEEKLPERPVFDIPVLSDIPGLGTILFMQHPLVLATIVFTAVLIWFFNQSRVGLVLRAVGESPESAHVLGYPVRYICFGSC